MKLYIALAIAGLIFYVVWRVTITPDDYGAFSHHQMIKQAEEEAANEWLTCKHEIVSGKVRSYDCQQIPLDCKPVIHDPPGHPDGYWKTYEADCVIATNK